jgi:type I restriction enzyme S subunit
MADRKFAPFAELFETPLRNGLTKPKAIRGEGMKMVNMGEVFAHRRIHDLEMDRVPMDSKERDSSLLRGGDLLFARQSLVLSGAGKCVLFQGDKEDVTFESHIIRCRLDPRKAEPAFYFYLFQSSLGRSLIESIVEQVAAAGIRGSDLGRLAVPVPPLAEQKAIAAVLGALDDKIELNRRMNATLEAMARALFQSWFVDFDPVRANMDRNATGQPSSRPTGHPSPTGRRDGDEGRFALDPATAALFPDHLEDSPIGHIPKGWTVATLDAIASVGSGKRPVGRNDTLSAECNIPLYGGGGRMGYVPCALYEKPILFTGRVGTLGLIFRTAEPSWPSDNTLIVEPQDGFFVFTYFVLQGFDLVTLNRGSTQPLLTQTDLKRQRFVLPPAAIVKAYAKCAAPIFDQITANENQSRTLATLRDTLLQKLLSGELSIATVKE